MGAIFTSILGIWILPFVACNEKIDVKYKTGFFAVVGCVVLFKIIFDVLL